MSSLNLLLFGSDTPPPPPLSYEMDNEAAKEKKKPSNIQIFHDEAPKKERRPSNIQIFNEKRALTSSNFGKQKPQHRNEKAKDKNLLDPESADKTAKHGKRRRHNNHGDSEVPDSTEELTPLNSSFDAGSSSLVAATPKLHNWNVSKPVSSPNNLNSVPAVTSRRQNISKPLRPNSADSGFSLASGSNGYFGAGNSARINSSSSHLPLRSNGHSNTVSSLRLASSISNSPPTNKGQFGTGTQSHIKYPVSTTVYATPEEEDAARWPHLYFAYGTDMSTYFLEKLCEDAAQAQAKISAKNELAATNGVDVGTAIVIDDESDTPVPSIEMRDQQPPAQRNLSKRKRGALETGDIEARRTVSKREPWSQEWREQYKTIGLGKLTGYIWIVDEEGEAKIFPSPSSTPLANTKASTSATFYEPGGTLTRIHNTNLVPKNPPTDRDTKLWRPSDWGAYYNPRHPGKPLPTGIQCSKWTKGVWDTYLGFPAAEQKVIPDFTYTKAWTEEMWIRYLMAAPVPVLKSQPAPIPSVKKPVVLVRDKVVVKKKEELVYGIIYRVSPFLYTLLCNYHASLSPRRSLLSRTISHQARTPDAQPHDWYASIEHTADIKVNMFVDMAGLTKGEKEMGGRKTVCGSMERKIAFNRAVLDLKGLAAPSVWIEDVVRQYVPRPMNPYESGCWY